ncbi:MAG TPA: CaiB/BaiF CoA-transferase family protein [Candidatus Limnocylindrales bacterium]|nr:CaiB/BaiF CoA-transferase family protein [Candidatus Limnocylindrales bacterium]
MSAVFKGLRVIDLTKIIVGPLCTMLLGDMGADVIKVEKPDSGDDSRYWTADPRYEGYSPYFLSVNRNKRSLTLDLKQPEGVEILKKLIEKADVLVENYRPGTMERMGLDYETLRRSNPGLIYCALSGYGSSGPYRDWGSYDVIISAVGGLMSITGEEGGKPVKVGVAVGDIITALYAYGAIVSALYARQSSQKGQKVEVSLLESQIASLINIASDYLNSGIIPQKWGTAHATIVPYQAFPVKDGYIVIGAGSDVLWKKLCKVLDLEELAEDPRFRTNPQRVKHRDLLVKILEEKLQTSTRAEWLEKLNKEGIPAGPINNLDEVFRDPQVNHLKMVQEVMHPRMGKVKLIRNPVTFSETPASIDLPPPLLGEHTEEILEQLLGYHPEQIQELKRKGVI